ncbi:oxidoreductase [Enterovibrio norvegicus FF-33]|uniref:Oxidoreductase n=2 Tax=Enterovibrio norvegicus TaxID=188144 RepID=A0A1E5BW41_9GAMM|nr:aldo/keto reductase [Enterovibrio norvegicus]OEE57447.1 oxidoreductase [Enterovibrio norvegicus FF-454]OEE67283.1 oxidoreductase [Enterovibrio norvegicus FF-33]
MKYSELHPSLSAFSRIVYGAWRLADDSDTSEAHVRAKVDACLEQGITTFDHADIYGDYACEAVFGQVLAAKPSLRDQIQLVSKCDIMLLSERYPQRRVKHYDTSAAHIRQSVTQSLKNLNTDYLDLVLIHRPDPFMDHLETGQALDALVNEGLVKGVGVSNFQRWDWDLLQSGMSHPLVTNQIEMNLLTRNSFTDGTLAFMQQYGVTPMAWSPLAGGELFGHGEAALRVRPLLEREAERFGVGIDAVATAWLLAHPAGIFPVLGTNNLSRIRTASDALNVSIDRETWFELWTAAAGEEVA